jgi:toxin-antitoxin system PIN domain toxin
MQLVDANVLLYAINEGARNHDRARGWLDESFAGRHTIGFAWIVLLAFLRLSTHRAVFPRPLSPEAACEVAERWLSQPGAVLVHPGERHLGLLAGLIGQLGAAGNLVNDAHLAALALEHGAQIVSFDADYARFEGVRWETPTATR